MASSRKNYTIYFKRNALKTLDTNDKNISATSRLLGVHRKCLQRWISQRGEIMKPQPGEVKEKVTNLELQAGIYRIN